VAEKCSTRRVGKIGRKCEGKKETSGPEGNPPCKVFSKENKKVWEEGRKKRAQVQGYSRGQRHLKEKDAFARHI